MAVTVPAEAALAEPLAVIAAGDLMALDGFDDARRKRAAEGWPASTALPIQPCRRRGSR